MTKVKLNAAEIVLTVITIVIIMSSCGGNNYTCPSYACNDEQSRPNLVFLNH